MGGARSGRQCPHDVAARHASDQAPVARDDSHGPFDCHLLQNRFQASVRLHGADPEVEQGGDGLRGAGCAEFVREDTADEPAVVVGDEPRIVGRGCGRRSGLSDRLRGNENDARTVGNLFRFEYSGDVDVLDEPRNILVRRASDDLLGLPDLDHLAVLHQDDAAAERYGFVEIMRNEDDRLPQLPLEFPQLSLHVAPDERVESAKGFVHQENVRISGQRPRKSCALLHPAGELMRILAVPALQADELNGLHRPLDALPGRNSPDLEAEADVSEDRPVRKERKVLEHHAELLLAECQKFLAAELGDIYVIHDDLSAARLDQSVHTAQQSRLSRPRKTHQDKNFSFGDIERDVAQADDSVACRSNFVLTFSFCDEVESLGAVRPKYLADAHERQSAHAYTPYRFGALREDFPPSAIRQVFI